MLPDINFILGQGGLGRTLPGQDYISGLIFYTNSLPSGFTATQRIKQLFAPSDAINVGIMNDYSDAVSSAAKYTVTNAGATGDTITLNVIGLSGNQVVLGSYTKNAVDTTPAMVAISIAAAINAGTQTHGFIATVSAAVITITAPLNYGAFLNTGTPLTAAYSTGATLAGTIAQFTGGVSSIQAIWYYHIKEFFRLQPGGQLYVGFFPVPSIYDFSEIATLQNFASGAIRQVGVYADGKAYNAGDMQLIHDVCAMLATAKKPLSALYAADLTGVTDISTLADLSLLTANRCSDIIAQDAGGLGAQLFAAHGKSITCLGALLGAVALANVGESIAWIQKFNMSDGLELDSIAFANGVPFTDASVSDNLLQELNNRRHIFLKKFIGISGSYFNDSHTAVIQSSDYAQIENNRTIDKACRLLYAGLLPTLNGPLTLNGDGTLANKTIAYLTALAKTALDPMARDSEISDFGVTVDATTNVQATSTIIISIVLVIEGVARQINVPIGFGSLS